MVNKKIIFLFLVLLIAAISLSPRFSLGYKYLFLTERSIDIRAEDILIFFGALFLILSFLVSGKKSFKKPPLFWPIFSWIIFGFFSIMVNLLIKDSNLNIFFFYFLKEIEFFVFYLLVFYCLSRFNINIELMKYWFIFCSINILWLLYVFIYQVRWSMYYGPNAFIEPKGPFPSGGFFLMTFIFLFNLFIFYYSRLNISNTKKILIFVLCTAPLFGVLASGSYTAIVGLIVSLGLSLFIYLVNKVGIVRLVKISLMILLMMIVVFQLIRLFDLNVKISKAKILWEYTSGDPVSRIGILKDKISYLFENSFINPFIGFGILGEAHSYYMRVLLERGLIGFLLFIWLMGAILLISYKGMKDKNNLYKKALSSGLFIATIAMLVMAIPNDVFAVVKLDEVYWFFAAMTMAAIVNNRKDIKNVP